MKTVTPKEVFAAHLQKKGLRATHQRDLILQSFLSADRHITADDLFAMVQKKDSSVGFATVYRNLRLLCESGIAEEIKIGNQKARYEQKVGQDHHDHLVCLKCGRFIEVRDEKIERLQVKLAEENGFLPIRHRLEIYGLCRKCR